MEESKSEYIYMKVRQCYRPPITKYNDRPRSYLAEYHYVMISLRISYCNDILRYHHDISQEVRK